MTQKQLKELSTLELLSIYNNKVRCIYSRNVSNQIFNELENRLGAEILYNLKLETFHMQNGEGDGMFNDEYNKLVKNLKQ